MLLSHIRLFVTPWTVAYHAPPSMEFAKQEYWSTLPFLLQRIFPTQGSNLALLHCRQMFYHLSHQGRYKPKVKEGLKPIIENLKKQGLLSPCNTPCNTPILSVKKSNGKWRLVQDLQIINEAVVPFTHMPKTNRFSCLWIWVNAFIEWIEAFPCHSEQAKEVIKNLIHEIIPRFGLLQSLQSDNGSAFKIVLPQGVSKTQRIKYHLHCSWRPQSSGKVEKANDFINRHPCTLTQETQGIWFTVLPIALMRDQTAPPPPPTRRRDCLYDRPFSCIDIVIDLEPLELTM